MVPIAHESFVWRRVVIGYAPLLRFLGDLR